jgi:HemY protein
MIRAGVVVLVVAIIAVGVLSLAGDPGRASVIWLGWRADMTAAAAVLIVLFGALLATIAWRTLLWILAAPRRAERTRAEARRRQAAEVLTRGFLAAAAGDGSEARRLAQKAAGLADETPGLVRLLAAQASEAAGDVAAAQAAYNAMLGFPEMRLAGHRGLMQLALAQGDQAAARQHAEAAFGQARTTRWAWRALLDARLEAADWEAGLELVKHAPEAKARVMALDCAVEAAKLQPGFAPGVVMAARLLALDGRTGKAAATLEQAWKAAPHPALWLAYRDLTTDETPRERAERLRDLAAQNPAHRESRILYVELALIAGDAAAARDAALGLEGEPLTARIAGLKARVAYALGQPDDARFWMAQGMSAPQEPDWSDLDPEGRAFAYHASDWARLVATFAEAGILIHPRHERHERGLSELPELPVAYAEAPPFLGADGREPVLHPLDESPFGDDEPEPAGVLAPARRSPVRRRLAGGRRTAK